MIPCPAGLARGKIGVVENPIGLGVIFVNVLCDQLDLPLPAVPTLIVASAMAASGQLPRRGGGVRACRVSAA